MSSHCLQYIVCVASNKHKIHDCKPTRAYMSTYVHMYVVLAYSRPSHCVQYIVCIASNKHKIHDCKPTRAYMSTYVHM